MKHGVCTRRHSDTQTLVRSQTAAVDRQLRGGRWLSSDSSTLSQPSCHLSWAQRTITTACRVHIPTATVGFWNHGLCENRPSSQTTYLDSGIQAEIWLGFGICVDKHVVQYSYCMSQACSCFWSIGPFLLGSFSCSRTHVSWQEVPFVTSRLSWGSFAANQQNSLLSVTDIMLVMLTCGHASACAFFFFFGRLP